MPGLEGTALNHYRLQRRLCRGGMSEVYLATDETTQQDVAIKLVGSSHAEYTERFLHEIETMRTLKHEHILPVLDSGEHGPWHYLVMPYIRQGTLHVRLRRGRLNFQEANEILEQVASALQFAHDHGIIHRDIKPSNILLNCSPPIYRGGVYLADFGLAKAIEDDYGITQTNCLMGTPEYLAPELMDGAASTRSDIYALGILLYEMMTGRVPFKASTPVGVCWKHLHEQPSPPSQLNPAISHATEQVILCALEKDPRCRFESATALLQAYQKSLEDMSMMSTGVMERSAFQSSAPMEEAEEAHVLAQSATFPALKIRTPAAKKTLRRRKTMPKRLPRRDAVAPLSGTVAPRFIVGGAFKSFAGELAERVSIFRPSDRAHSILVAFTVFIFLLTTSLSLGLYVASNGLRTYYSAYVASTTPLITKSRTQQKLITPTFNIALHHLEGNRTDSPTLRYLPPAKSRHSRGNKDSGANAGGTTVEIGNDPNTSRDFGIGNDPKTTKGLIGPWGNNLLPGNRNGNYNGSGNDNGDGNGNGNDNGNGNGNG